MTADGCPQTESKEDTKDMKSGMGKIAYKAVKYLQVADRI
jgi:hypothetical protein